MADLSQMSDAELLAIYNAPQAPASPAMDLSSMSNEDLLAIYNAPKPKEGGISATAADIAKSAGSGAVRGVTSLAGLPSWAAGGISWLADTAAEKITGQPVPAAIKKNAVADAISTDAINKAIDAATGAPVTSYKPQTLAGEYARTTGEFLPGLMTPGGAAAKVIGGVMVPAILSETAGQLTKGTAAEPYARAAGGIVGGVGAAIASRPNTAQAALAPALQGVDEATIDAAAALMKDARDMGTKLTWSEAINQVSGGSAAKLAALQRSVENSVGGSAITGPFMAERTQGIAANAPRIMDATLGPRSARPTAIGPAVGKAASAEIDDVQAGINAATRPLYKAAEPVQVGAPVNAALMSDALYAKTLAEVRSNPALNRTIENLPDDAVGVIDMVQRRMRENADNARIPGQASSGNTIAAAFEDARTAPIAAAETVTGSNAASGAVGTYEAARAGQEALRTKYLEPLMNGPVGKLANKDIATKQAIEVLFPANPLPGSAPEIVEAMTAVKRRNPVAAQELLRTHAEMVFNEATQALQGGANQFGGAGFAAVLRGNKQQAENLAAAIQATHGPQALEGFDRFLDVMSATGQRQRMGSPTAFNTEIQETLKGGKMLGEIAATAASGGFRWPGSVSRAYESYRLGRNTEDLARLLTDQKAVGVMKQLAKASSPAQAQVLAARLTQMAINARTAAEKK